MWLQTDTKLIWWYPLLRSTGIDKLTEEKVCEVIELYSLYVYNVAFIFKIHMYILKTMNYELLEFEIVKLHSVN